MSDIGGHTFVDYLELGAFIKNWSAQDNCREKSMEAKTTLLVSTVWMPYVAAD
jgi:hypothetical protein